MDFSLPVSAALWFLPFALPICLWVAYSDMKAMKIPNKAVVALAVVFLAVGLIALPFDTYLWQLPHLVVVLVIGFVLSVLGMVGAGDAKFAAAMAPFVLLADVKPFLVLFAATVLVCFTAHRLFRRTSLARKLAPTWESWDTRDFPMGLALGTTMALYLCLAAL